MTTRPSWPISGPRVPSRAIPPPYWTQHFTGIADAFGTIAVARIRAGSHAVFEAICGPNDEAQAGLAAECLRGFDHGGNLVRMPVKVLANWH